MQDEGDLIRRRDRLRHAEQANLATIYQALHCHAQIRRKRKYKHKHTAVIVAAPREHAIAEEHLEQGVEGSN